MDGFHDLVAYNGIKNPMERMDENSGGYPPAIEGKPSRPLVLDAWRRGDDW